MPDSAEPLVAVLPVAGLSTRFAPATKVVPKSLLPVVDKPVLEHVVDEAVDAGATRVVLVTGEGQEALVQHFRPAPVLEAALERKGDTTRLAAVRRSTEMADVTSVRQPEARGLGHAVLMAADEVGDRPFLVLLGDEFMDPTDPLLSRMRDVQREQGGIVLALLQVPLAQISRYGSVAVEPTGADGVLRVTAMVEKPPADEAPSDLAIIGRYVLPSEIFAELSRTGSGAGGEIQLTDAMAGLLAAGTPVHGVVVTGTRYDTGDRLGYLQTVIALAAAHPETGPQLRPWLQTMVAGLEERR